MYPRPAWRSAADGGRVRQGGEGGSQGVVGEAASGQASVAAAGRAAAAGLRSGVESRSARGSETARAVADVGGAGPRQGRLGSYAVRGRGRSGRRAVRVGDRWIEGLTGLPGEMVTGTGARGSRYGLERGSSHTACARATWLLVFVLELQMQYYRCYFSRR